MLLKKDFEGVSKQCYFKTSVERATSIQKGALDDSIIARRCHAAAFSTASVKNGGN
jgi:hypothetical protein